MYSVIALVLGAAVGACANRIRGGFLGDRWGVRGQASRGIYAALLTGVVLCAGWPWPVGGWRLAVFAVLLLATWFIGATAFGTFHSIDAGRVEGRPLKDGLLNAARGALYTLPPAILLAALRFTYGDRPGVWAAVLMPLCGALQGIAYEGSWRWRPLPRWKPTEWAESFSGAAFGAGAAAAALA